MQKTILIITLIILLISISQCHYNCQFDKLYKNYQHHPSAYQKKYDTLQLNQQIYGRSLLALTRFPLRITLRDADLGTINSPSGSASSTTITKLNFIKRAMQVTQAFYQSRLKVTRLGQVMPPSLCAGYITPSSDVLTGVASTDLLIYVTYVTDSAISYGATGKSCQQVNIIANISATPDTTLQHGRPNVGRIQFNTYKIVDQQSILSNRLFSSITATCLHQCMHILGFDYSLYDQYLDPTTGYLYNSSITTSQVLHASRPLTYLITTPSVTTWARTFFNCPSITGMQLQNNDPQSPGSHWQRVMMYDQLMTSTSLGAQKGFSGLTYALLQDMGWYQVDDTFNDTTNYGYQKGCTFFTNACYGTSFPQYFCNTGSQSNISYCSTNFLGKALCINDNQYMSDGCPIYVSYFNCVDNAVLDQGVKAVSLQNYDVTSFCVLSNFGTYSLGSSYLSRCYPYVCQSATQTIIFTVGTASVYCTSAQAGAVKTLAGTFGSLTCPVYADYCTNSRKLCPNWCSMNGFCTRGQCNCLPGYYGPDCSITSCTTGQYYNPSTLLCSPTCPSGTYANIYSKSCRPCKSPCFQCRDQQSICTSCPLTTPRQVFYNSACISSCPSTTYLDGDVCKDCNATFNNCATCSYQSTNCTSCLNGLYLQNPIAGACIATCSGTYFRTDIVNGKCVSSCADNLIQNGTICQLCQNGTYKRTSDNLCHSTCLANYYADPVRRFCQQCNTTCNTCVGGYPQNCTSCFPNSYLILSMCTGTCPRGFYANDSSLTCQLCTLGLQCSTCYLNNITVKCLSCKYGYYYQMNQTCLLNCDQYYYKNTWNHSCDACHYSCGDCTSPDQSSCTNCRNPKYFLTNITGGYCLDSCPTQKYLTSGVNCVPCHYTCLTCNGDAASNCLQCIPGLYKGAGYCRYVCPQKFYPNQTTSLCQSCDATCKYCKGSTNQSCTVCANGLYLNNVTCVTECPPDLPAVQLYKVCFQYRLKMLILLLVIWQMIF